MTRIVSPSSLGEASPVAVPDAVSFEAVSKSFGTGRQRTAALKDVSLRVRTGSFVSLVGPSGCGKTTLLNLAAGLIAPDAGRVAYGGTTITGPNKLVGYLTQDDALLPWRSVAANVGLPLEIRRVPRLERREAVRVMIERVGLAGFESHRPSQLSGGMRKRVSLARTLIYRPETLLLDEPFGALDAQTRVLMQRQLQELVETLGLTVLLVTHDLDEAIALSDTIVVFSKRPATIIEVAEPHRKGGRDVRRRAQDADLYDHLWSRLAGEVDIAR